VTIDGSSLISADGKGYPAKPGDGAGAGYGGRGGDSAWGAKGGDIYGSAVQPMDLGSGGENHCSGNKCYSGGDGGGAIFIEVSQLFTLDGTLSTNGENAGNGWKMQGGGGGSGGSVYVIANEITGGGLISANGGRGYGYGGGGSGGRVAVEYESNSFPLDKIYTAGGISRWIGGPGTIYIKDLDEIFWGEVDI